jgi:chaperone modulatory protein CbpM
METHEFLLHARLDAKVLDAWLEAGWLAPRRDAKASPFSEIDVARAQLIRDLRDDLGVNDEGVSVVLDLVDQVHGLRRMLRELLSSMQAQPDMLRSHAPAGPGGKRRRGSGANQSR